MLNDRHDEQPVVLVDDGLASGFTMKTAVKAVRRQGAARVVIAVPTAHADSVGRVLPHVDQLYCANLRSGWSFAVADAYKDWYDVSEAEAAQVLESTRRRAGRASGAT